MAFKAIMKLEDYLTCSIRGEVFPVCEKENTQVLQLSRLDHLEYQLEGFGKASLPFGFKICYLAFKAFKGL